MNNPNLWKKIGIGAAITGGTILTIALIPIGLGFGIGGIVAGSAAAAIQSVIGNVAAGSLFAVATSLGMTGVFASTAAVGAILGAGGLAVYLKNRFSPEKDAELINNIIINRDNPDLIIRLLEMRFPQQREEIRNKYNELYPNDDFDEDIINYVTSNSKEHIKNLLKKTNDILPQTDDVILLLNGNFEDYCNKDFNCVRDSILIDNIIKNNDNPLLIIRLLNYRNENERKEIDLQFREIRNNKNKKMLLYIIDFMPDHPEISYSHMLLDMIE